MIGAFFAGVSLFMKIILIVSILALFIVAYRIYGRFLNRRLGVRENGDAPAFPILLAQHTSCIAAAGPIIGPIVAGLSYGWLPAMLWIVFGSIFIGAVHDFATLTASRRHRSRSIAAIVKEHMSPKIYRFLSLLIWISLSYLIVVFTQMTVKTFTHETYGSTVATSSLYFLLLSLILGWLLNKGPFPLWITTALALPFLPILLELSRAHPLPFSEWMPFNPVLGWTLIILGYCFVASVLPMEILLKPRGYLGGWLLFFTLAIGLLGLFIGDDLVTYPAFIGFWSPQGEPLFPILFVTIACGACSGFHGLVCSGISSKQLEKEGDAQAVGYGGMLIEGFVAVIALMTLMISTHQEAPGDPVEIYVNGLARFARHLGIPLETAIQFGFLAMATFVYDSLDVATRIGKGLFQEWAGWEEWTGWKGWLGGIGATVAALALPLLLLAARQDRDYLDLWPAFGISNQLLAAFSLLGVSAWLMKSGRKPIWALAPMAWMFLVALSAALFWMVPWMRERLVG